MIVYRANPSLRNKLVRAKLKQIQTTKPNVTPSPTLPLKHNPHIQPNYPFNLFENTSQNFRNPIKRHNKTCEIYKQLNTTSFAYSTTRSTKTPINTPPQNKHYNCQTKNVVYLTTCKFKNCGAQYVGYTMREIYKRLCEHKTTYESAIRNHCYTHNYLPFKLDVQILTQAPNNEQNPELWLKQQESILAFSYGASKQLIL